MKPAMMKMAGTIAAKKRPHMVLFATVFISREVVRAGIVITVLPSKFAFTMFINRFLLETLAKEVRRFSFMNIEQGGFYRKINVLGCAMGSFFPTRY